MNNGIISGIFLLLWVNFAISSTVHNELKDCNIRVVEWNDMLAHMSDAVEGSESVEFVTECSELIRNLIGVTSRRRNSLRKRRAEVNRIYEETEAALLQNEQPKAKALRSIPEEARDKYKQAFESLGVEIKGTRSDIDSKLKDQAALKEKIKFYELEASLSSESNDTFCQLDQDNGRQLIKHMQENFLLLTGTNFDDKCKVLLNKMTNIKSLEDYSFEYDEKKLELLNRTFTERLRVIEEILRDNEAGHRDFEAIKQDNLEGLKSFRDEVSKINDALEKELIEKANHFSVRMLQKGIRFEDVAIAIEDVTNDVVDPLKYVLDTAYKCKVKYLGNVVSFSQNNGLAGFPIIMEKMKTCKHLDQPIIIKMAKLYKSDELDAHAENVYEKLSRDVRSNATDSVVKIVKDLKVNYIDVPKIVRLSYDGETKNFLPVSQFIEELGTVPQSLEDVLYDEMINNSHADTQEHVMFGVFIRKLMVKAHKDSDTNRIQKLEAVKNRLPDGIKNLCFANAVSFSDGSRRIGDPLGHKTDFYNKGLFFRFESARDLGNYMYAGNLGTVQNPITVLSYGINLNDPLWTVTPTENAEYFYIRSRAHGLSISSKPYSMCLKYKTNWNPWKDSECDRFAHYNILKNAHEPPQKLLIKEA